jgi:hypothetical protein
MQSRELGVGLETTNAHALRKCSRLTNRLVSTNRHIGCRAQMPSGYGVSGMTSLDPILRNLLLIKPNRVIAVRAP